MRYTEESRRFYAALLDFECPAAPDPDLEEIEEAIDEWTCMLNHFSDLSKAEKRSNAPNLKKVTMYDNEISGCKRHIQELKGKKNELKRRQLTA